MYRFSTFVPNRKEGKMYGFRSTAQAYLSAILLALALFGCKAGEGSETKDKMEQQPVAGADEWLTNLIQQLREEDAANPPAKIYRYTYNDKVVYYLSGRCCDIPSTLYDVEGNVLCEPDGGFTGKGDGHCTDFFEKRTEETLIWEDKREFN